MIIILLSCIWAAYITTTFYPVFLFDKKTKHDNYFIYSDNETDFGNVVNTIDSLLQKSEIYETYDFEIALCDSYSKYAFLSNIAYDSFGIAKSFTNFIILSKTDIKNNLIIAATKANNKRKISTVLAHEITHILISKHYGLYRFIIPKWKEEGYCEYIANDSSYDTGKGIENFINQETDNTLSYDYFKYRLCITYLIDVKEKSFSQIVEEDIKVKDIENEIRDYLKSGNFIF